MQRSGVRSPRRPPKSPPIDFTRHVTQECYRSPTGTRRPGIPGDPGNELSHSLLGGASRAHRLLSCYGRRLVRRGLAVAHRLPHLRAHRRFHDVGSSETASDATAHSTDRLQNHLRVKREASARENDSCMKPVPACVAFSSARQAAISFWSRLVSARVTMPSGQIIPRPECGPPRPSPAGPR